MKIKRYLASEFARLDSNVLSGGGTDDTAALQSILDRAQNGGEGVYLVMDGAALITGLKVYSNTTIECLSKDCGFFLADHADCAVVANGTHVRQGEIVDHNITLDGGTYNQNCPNQRHSFHRDDNGGYCPGWGLLGTTQSVDLVVNLFFVGVKNLTLKNLVIRDQRTYALAMSNWERVTVDNVWIDLPGRVHGQNQDGFHFFGPGRFLNVRNVGGCTSDDFIALAPDERDGCSSITDVLIDGVTLDDADQAIRMLCHHKGRLDRVLVRNVTGTYRSFGFFINPFHNTGVAEEGGYGDIVIENVNLRSNGVDYDYTAPFLFRVGGRVKSLTLRNIQHISPTDSRFLLDVGLQYYVDDAPQATQTTVDSLLIDGLHAVEDSPLSADTQYIRLGDCTLGNLTVRNVEIERSDAVGRAGIFLSMQTGAQAGHIRLKNISTQGVEELISREKGCEIHSLTVDAVEMK